MLFNTHPKNGLSKLHSLGVVGSNPSEIAHFLKSRKGGLALSSKMIGDFLSSPHPDCQAVLEAYLKLFDFEVLNSN